MKLEIDETNKTIKVKELTNLKELYDYLNDHNYKLKEWSITNNVEWYYYPYYPVEAPIITYTTASSLISL